MLKSYKVQNYITNNELYTRKNDKISIGIV